MRHTMKSTVVAGAAALLLASGTGTAAAQGSLQFTLPFPFAIPGPSSLAPSLAPAVEPAPATAAEGVPAELMAVAFEGRVVAAMNEARLAVGADRLVTDPELEASARERADQLARGATATGDLPAPDSAETQDRTVLALPAGATPQKVLSALLADTGMRERMLDGELVRVGVGMATAADGTVHVVQDFARS